MHLRIPFGMTSALALVSFAQIGCRDQSAGPSPTIDAGARRAQSAPSDCVPAEDRGVAVVVEPLPAPLVPEKDGRTFTHRVTIRGARWEARAVPVFVAIEEPRSHRVVNGTASVIGVNGDELTAVFVEPPAKGSCIRYGYFEGDPPGAAVRY